MFIQRLRDGSGGIPAKILIGLIIIVFALFGFGSITTFLAPVAKVALVNGDEVTQVEMETTVERNRRLLLAQNMDPLAIDEDLLRENILQTLIARKLLGQVSDELNLTFSDGQLDEEIVEMEMFQIDGQYSAQQFQLVIGSAGFSPMSYREEMRRDKIFRQLANAIVGSAFLTDWMVSRTGEISGQSRDVAYLRVEVDSLLEQIEVSDEELQTAYRGALKDYETEETVDIGYVELKRADLMDEVTFSEVELASYYEDTKDVYSKSERRRLAHILIESTESDSAKTRIHEIYETILAGGEFGQLARERSEDPGSASNDGELGFSERGAFATEFEEVAFNLNLNEVSQPVETEFGYHIIKLLDLEPEVVPSLDEVRDTVEKAYRGYLAEDIFVTRSSKLSELAFESADLQLPATALNLLVKSTGPIGQSATVGIAGNAEVMDVAFSADILIDGNNSEVIEITPNHHVVIRVNSHQPSEIRPYEEVIDEVRETVTRDSAVQLAQQQAKEMVSMLDSGSLTRFVADQFDLKWEVVAELKRIGSALNSEITDKAFSLPRPLEGGKSVGYIVLTDGDAVVISVTNVKNLLDSQITGAEFADLSRSLVGQRGSIDYQEFEQSLLSAADVERVR